MVDRSWFFAFQGQQRGPYPEPQFRQLVTNGTVTTETLVWTEGMANWQKGGDVPGLFSSASDMPEVPPPGSFPLPGGSRGAVLSIDLGLWDFTWRTLALLFGLALVIPTPWVVADVLPVDRFMRAGSRTAESEIQGSSHDAAVVFRGPALLIVVARINSRLVNLVSGIVQLVVYWLFIRWFIANLSPSRQPLVLRFSGSFWGYLGWSLLAFVSMITIIGWAWVYVAQVRWMCRHVEGTRREVVFNATGLEFLWRSVVTLIACAFIIPIPWVMPLVHQLAGVTSRAGRAIGPRQRLNALTCAGAASLPAPPTPPACRPA